MSDEAGAEANLSLGVGRTAADSLPFKDDNSGASSGNYSLQEVSEQSM